MIWIRTTRDCKVTQKLHDHTWKSFSFFHRFCDGRLGRLWRYTTSRYGIKMKKKVREREKEKEREDPDVTRRTVITRTSRASESYELKIGRCVYLRHWHVSSTKRERRKLCKSTATDARHWETIPKNPVTVFSNANDFKKIDCICMVDREQRYLFPRTEKML